MDYQPQDVLRYLDSVPRGSNTPPGPLSHAVAGILRASLTSQGLTQAGLGKLVGQSQSMVSDHLRGARVLDLETLLCYCQALKLDILETIGEALDQMD